MVKVAFFAALAGLAANVAAGPHFKPTGNFTTFPGGPTATPSLVPWKTANGTLPKSTGTGLPPPPPTGTGIPPSFPRFRPAKVHRAVASALDADSFSSLASEVTSLASGGSDSLESIVSVLESFLGNSTIPTAVTSDTDLSSVLSVVNDVVKIVEAVVSQLGDLGSLTGLKEKRQSKTDDAANVEKRQSITALLSLGTVLFKIVTSVISLAESAISSGAASSLIGDIETAVKALLSVASGLGLGI